MAMSSIDKYVIQEAQSIDPRVTVVNLFGRIKGYIGGVKVFDISADFRLKGRRTPSTW